MLPRAILILAGREEAHLRHADGMAAPSTFHRAKTPGRRCDVASHGRHGQYEAPC
jgi:hypothetical protein